MSSNRPGFLQRLFGSSERTIKLEKRRAKRESISIPVKASIGSRELNGPLAMNLSPIGLFVKASPAPPKGSAIDLVFHGLAENDETINVTGKIVWISRLPEEGMGVEIDRAETSEENLKRYRSMVLYYIRHPPLLDETKAGFNLMTCSDCGWVGKVSSKHVLCSKCGSTDLVPQ